MTSLRLDGVSKSLGGVPVLTDISFSVASGSRMAIVGPSGSGKSTLLRLIAGFDRTDAGRILLGGRVACGPNDFIPAHRRGVGYVAQDGALFPHLTAEQNIGFGIGGRAARKERVREVADLVSFDASLLKRYPHELSGGQQQRVALARALAPSPGVILLDEPFSALDTGLRLHTRQSVILALERTGVTTILVTHDQDEAMRFGHEIGVLEGGRMIQTGATDAVFGNPADARTAEFLGAAIFLPAVIRDGIAVTSLGPLAVRFDNCGGADRALAMVRPEQVKLAPREDGVPARVLAVRSQGSHLEVDVCANAPDAATLTVRVPRYRAGEFTVGATTRLLVRGSVVLYPF